MRIPIGAAGRAGPGHANIHTTQSWCSEVQTCSEIYISLQVCYASGTSSFERSEPLRSNRVLFAVLLCLAGVSACAPRTVTQVARIPFPQAEYDRLSGTGTAVVSGQAFMKTGGGEVKTAAGRDVLLNPVTSYSNQWYEVAYIQRKPIAKADSTLSKYVLRQTADAEGRFTFRNVPSGDYYVVAPVYWDEPGGNGGSPVHQGGLIAKRISVAEGDTLHVVLTR
jgi:hypothetical protein